MRADQRLVELGLALSRNQAQSLIEAGAVFTIAPDGATAAVKKPSQKIPESVRLEVREAAEATRYVSRGGLKLESALAQAGLDVSGALVLDVGLSTGGFTDCVLQKGARQVVGVDVGHGQLAAKLAQEPRLRSLEGVNARHLSSEEIKSQILALTGGELFDLIVMDLSFISLTLVLPELPSFVKPVGHILALVKPQFEVGRENLGKNGIVKDPNLWTAVEDKIRAAAQSCGLQMEDYFASSIAGTDGNQEFFACLRP